MSRPTVLLADDDLTICTVLSQAVRRCGFNVVTTDDAAELLDWAQQGKGDLVIMDVIMPKGNGLEAIPKLKQHRPDLPVIVISANNTLMTAVKATELGAFEYFPKPFDLDALVSCVSNLLLEHAFEEGEAALSGEQLQAVEHDAPLIGRSPAMQEVYKTLARLVPVDLTVMLQGESGTGKELIARALHTLSHRRERPFVAINMAAMPRELVESELFGHEKGAFTGALARKPGRFEQAEGGTLFLDEIGDMPLEAQTKLLRTLQEQEYTPIGATQSRKTNVRIICATHRDVQELVQTGQFREDLFFRLNVVPIYIPPLRERREDVEELALHFLAKAKKKGLPEKRFSIGAMKLVQEYHWPGNVREMENFIYRLAALHSEAVLEAGTVQEALYSNKKAPQPAKSATATCLQETVEGHLRQYFAAHKGELPVPGLYDRILDTIEKPLLKVTMEAVDGNQLRAAELLGINRNTLRKKLRERGLMPITGRRT